MKTIALCLTLVSLAWIGAAASVVVLVDREHCRRDVELVRLRQPAPAQDGPTMRAAPLLIDAQEPSATHFSVTPGGTSLSCLHRSGGAITLATYCHNEHHVRWATCSGGCSPGSDPGVERPEQAGVTKPLSILSGAGGKTTPAVGTITILATDCCTSVPAVGATGAVFNGGAVTLQGGSAGSSTAGNGGSITLCTGSGLVGSSDQVLKIESK